jgi:GNAT superfamily N-acetyltransferase
MIALDDNPARLDFDRIHGWIAQSYWAPGIARDLLARAVAGSHPLGAYVDGVQIGFARAITDHATFAWIADVWVDEAHRGAGVAQRMIDWFIDHPDFSGIRRFALVTADAHGVYAKSGFTPLLRADRYMERLSPAARALLESSQ